MSGNTCFNAVVRSKLLIAVYFRYLNAVNKMALTPNRVAKVTKDRVFSVAVHPTREKVLVMAGDKWGKIGFWDLVSVHWITAVRSQCLPRSQHNSKE